MDFEKRRLYDFVRDFQGLIIFVITLLWYGSSFFYVLLDPVKSKMPIASLEIDQGILLMSGFAMAAIIIIYLVIYSGVWLTLRKFKFATKIMLTSTLFFIFPVIYKLIPEMILWASVQAGISWGGLYLLYLAKTSYEGLDKVSLVMSFLMFVYGYMYTFKIFVIV